MSDKLFTPAGRLEMAQQLLKIKELFQIPAKLQEDYSRFGIPLKGGTLFSDEKTLIYDSDSFVLNPVAIFDSPLETKLGKALYGE